MISEDAIEVVVEVPKGTRNKYEYDHSRHVIVLDRRLFSSTRYPVDYGFLPNSLAEDGDPLDVLIVAEDPTFPGCYVRVRPIGTLEMTDEHGPDTKVLAVVAGDPAYLHVKSTEDVLPSVLAEIRHFFDIYKELEPGKHTEVGDFGDAQTAWTEIGRCLERARRQES